MFPLARKSQAPDKILQLFELCHTRYGRYPAAIRSDRGREFINRALQTAATDRGIEWEPTAPYTPDQDGKAERMNRTLIQQARSMMIASGLPSKL